MSNFTALNNYQLPVDVLLDLLSIYNLNGKNELAVKALGEKNEHLEKKTIENNTIALIKFLKLNISADRIRLLITKDSAPRNKEEKCALAIKQVLISIKRSAFTDNLPINSSDILDFLKHIYGNNIRFNMDDFVIHGSRKRSIRFEFNSVLDELDQYFSRKQFEPICLSCIAMMEMYNIKPYSEYNTLAFILTFYYLLLRCRIVSFKYVSFVELFIKHQQEIETTITSGSINYDQGTLFFTSFIQLTLKLIKSSYDLLDEILISNNFEKRAHKSDHIEQAIINEVPDLFSKEDIIKLYPDVSLSTIMRALTKLHKMNYIIPLGRGRNAKWKRIINPNALNFVIKSNEDE